MLNLFLISTVVGFKVVVYRNKKGEYIILIVHLFSHLTKLTLINSLQ